MILEKNDPLMIPRVGFHEGRANKNENPRSKLIKPCRVLREGALEDEPTIH
jgi:hypothetical protein